MRKASSLDPRIASAVAQMERRLGEPLSVCALAAHARLSESRFRQLFVEQTGALPEQYLQSLRLRRARLLLERTFLTVRAVMALVGYDDPAGFARDFRLHHDILPDALRRGGIATPLTHPDDRRPCGAH
jgi:transcriptional regulator GlxA family with amidase domain